VLQRRSHEVRPCSPHQHRYRPSCPWRSSKQEQAGKREYPPTPLSLGAPVSTAPARPLLSSELRLSPQEQPRKQTVRLPTRSHYVRQCSPHQYPHYHGRACPSRISPVSTNCVCQRRSHKEHRARRTSTATSITFIAALVQTGAATEAGSASDNAAPTGCTSARDTSTANIVTTAALVQAGAAPRQEVRLLTPLPRGTPVPTARALPLPHQSCACSSKGSHESRKCVCQHRFY
jgi:hypothetical protein